MKPQFSSVPRAIGKLLGEMKRRPHELPKDCIWSEEDLRVLLVPWLDVLREAVHFELPPPKPELERENGWRDALIKQKQKGIKLPYPVVTIYARAKDLEIFTIWSEQIVNPMQIALFLPDIEGDYQDEESAIWGRTFVKRIQFPDWEVAPYDLSSCRTLMNQLPETQANCVRFPMWAYGKAIDYAGSKGFEDEYKQEFALLDVISLRLLMSLCTAFDIGKHAVTEKVVSSLSHQRKSGKQGKKKNKSFYEIHRIVYEPAKLSLVSSEPKGGTHASPRWHKRRGYWRTMKKSGKVVWVQSCEVGKKSDGMVYKDYEVVI